MKSKENELSQGEPAKRQRIDGSQTPAEFRVLVTNEESSVIIGRRGANAERIRAESGTILSILKTEGPPNPASERVMVIKGLPAQITNAINIIVSLLSQNIAEKTPENPEPQVTIKFLVHKFLAGCIIGPAGTIMQEIQNSTSARITLSNEPLPGSTEKSCSVIGAPSAVCAAAARVIEQVTSTPLRPGSSSVLFVPGGFTMPGFAAPPGFSPGLPGPGGPPGPSYVSQLPPHLVVTEKVIIPDTCSGVVIGKGGSIIKGIKARTETNISLAEPNEAKDRVVTISGSAQGVAAAIALIRERVENYHPMKEQPRY